MSQRHVERVIGLLVTDEEFRRQFAHDPVKAIRGAIACGAELTEVEVKALAAIDASGAARFAETLDPRLQKVCFRASGEAC